MQRCSQAQRSTDSSATVYSPDLPHRMDECLETVAGVLANIEIFFRSSCRIEKPQNRGEGSNLQPRYGTNQVRNRITPQDVGASTGGTKGLTWHCKPSSPSPPP